MLQKVPRLQDYDVSPETGFLPAPRDLVRELPMLFYYGIWETLARDFPAVRLAGRLRETCDAMPTLSIAGLQTTGQQRRAFSILAFLAHSYVWGGETPADRLPPGISVPLTQLAERLEVPPVNCYASCVLWNYRALFEEEELDLRNLATTFTFSGSTDESWFYLVSVEIEARGGGCLDHLLRAIQACRASNTTMVITALSEVAEHIRLMTASLVRMYEHCDPHTFYYRIRPFLAGWKNMAESGLPRGVVYDGASPEYRQLSGGSNAQSSLIQAMDIALGILHRPTGEAAKDAAASPVEGQAPPPSRHGFIAEMREYMPGPHRRFLEHLESVACIRDYVHAREDSNEALASVYSLCVQRLADFRGAHLQIVTRYIIVQSKQPQPKDPQPGGVVATKHVGLSEARPRTEGERGTGGTQLIPFLKQARSETSKSAMTAFMTQSPVVPPPLPFTMTAEERERCRVVPGLAGHWTVQDEMGGGICSY